MKKQTNVDDWNQRGTAGDSETIPVVEESAKISRHVVDNGSVRLKKIIEEENVNIQHDVAHEDLEIRRISINKPVESPPAAVRYEGETMIVSVLREEIIVEKRLILAEEIHITKKVIIRKLEEPVVLRRERIAITRVDADGREISEPPDHESKID